MAQKLWEKNVQVNADIDRFTVGKALLPTLLCSKVLDY